MKTVLLALIALTAQAAPVLSPDGVNLSPSDPGINATVYAVQGSTWLVGWNDNPTPGDFDFNDFMYTIAFSDGHGTARFFGATSALYNRAYLTAGMREITRNEPLQFLAQADAAYARAECTAYGGVGNVCAGADSVGFGEDGMSDDNAVFDEDDYKDYDDYDGYGYEPTCTHCGGETLMEANEAHNDYINFGDELVKCPYCRGTGLRKHQTVF